MTDIYFPVEKIPMKDFLPNYEYPSGISNAIVAHLPKGKKRILQYCSDLYTLLPNSEIIPLFDNEISKYYRIDKKVKMNTWSKFFIDFILIEKFQSIGIKEDRVFPKVRLVNSYDGSIRYHFSVGFYRQICENGLAIPEGQLYQINSMHTPKIGNETSFEVVMEMTSKFLAESNDIMLIYHELQSQGIKDWENRIEEIGEFTSFPVSLLEDVNSRMSIELDLYEGIEPNDWLLYNSFNYQLNHNEGFKAKQSKKDAIDQEVLDYILKY